MIHGLQRLFMVTVRFAHCLGDYLGDWMVRKLSKERLEDIKTWLNRGFDLIEEDIEWLIEQAKRVQELEKQNKRYREAIERALDESSWGDEGNALYRMIGILTKALEGEE